jgi:hypothetical protein
MSNRLVVAVFLLFSAVLLLLFSFMMKGRSITFALIAAKHGDWDMDQKAAALRNASIMAGLGGIIALAAEAIFGWFANTGPGQAMSRFWRYWGFKAYRLVWSKSSESGIKSSDNSDEDEARELEAVRRGSTHRRTASGTRRAQQIVDGDDGDTSAVPSAAPEVR